ncbi:UNVERIFIED_CONTAM: hypothetical protein GTU68_048777 [Idotea baltica]|nr:hypothetical protein [Idotea baltica]
MQALFMSDFLGRWESECTDLCLDHFSAPIAARPFTEKLIQGVLAHKTKVDAELTCASENWSLSRMGRVDRAILRVATYEIIFLDDIPINVAINEAIEVAKRFGADESPQFINGVLDRVASTVRSSRGEPKLEVIVDEPTSSDDLAVDQLIADNLVIPSDLGGELE